MAGHTLKAGIAPTRKEALEQGLRYYHSTCDKHGACLRYTSNYSCVTCTNDLSDRKKEERLHRTKQWKKDNPERSKEHARRVNAKATKADFPRVYIIECPEAKKMKIGYTTLKRKTLISRYTTNGPLPVRLLYLQDYDTKAEAMREEKRMHDIFKHRWSHGEWFYTERLRYESPD
jgi:predicted GIY-YIG superfamily endonuclease